MTFKSLGIDVANPINPVISESSVMKIGCSTVTDDTSLAAAPHFDSFDEISATIVKLTNQINNSTHQINDLKVRVGECHHTVESIVVCMAVEFVISIGLFGLFIYFMRRYIKSRFNRLSDTLRAESLNTIRTFDDSLMLI